MTTEVQVTSYVQRLVPSTGKRATLRPSWPCGELGSHIAGVDAAGAGLYGGGTVSNSIWIPPIADATQLYNSAPIAPKTNPRAPYKKGVSAANISMPNMPSFACEGAAAKPAKPAIMMKAPTSNPIAP